MAPQIERATESCVLGEGPHWDASSQSLYFVDVFGKNILKYKPTSNTLTKASVAPRQPSFVIPVEGSRDKFVLSAGTELSIISWDGESDQISTIETLSSLDSASETSNKKFNDGKCDSSGRLWAGAYVNSPEGLLKIEPLGTLYSLSSKRQLKEHVSQVRVSNGMAFNDHAKKMYYIDSLKGTIDQFDFDITNGTVSNRRDWFTLNKHNIPGFPDGMTIDTDGNLWVAIFGGGRVLKIYGDKPETLLETIEIPAAQVTSLAFGGANLDELYVTTGAFEYEGQKPLPPINGATYRIKGTGSKGLPGVSFKLQ